MALIPVIKAARGESQSGVLFSLPFFSLLCLCSLRQVHTTYSDILPAAPNHTAAVCLTEVNSAPPHPPDGPEGIDVNR